MSKSGIAVATLFVSYLPASYLYWVALKLLGLAIHGHFVFRDPVPAVHGTIPLAYIIIFSPVWLPFNLLLALGWGTIGYADPNFDEPLANVALEYGAFFISLGVCWCLCLGLVKLWAGRKKGTF
jgi:hypothetical protein